MIILLRGSKQLIDRDNNASSTLFILLITMKEQIKALLIKARKWMTKEEIKQLISLTKSLEIHRTHEIELHPWLLETLEEIE